MYAFTLVVRQNKLKTSRSAIYTPLSNSIRKKKKTTLRMHYALSNGTRSNRTDEPQQRFAEKLNSEQTSAIHFSRVFPVHISLSCCRRQLIFISVITGRGNRLLLPIVFRSATHSCPTGEKTRHASGAPQPFERRLLHCSWQIRYCWDSVYRAETFRVRPQTSFLTHPHLWRVGQTRVAKLVQLDHCATAAAALAPTVWGLAA